MSASWRPLTNVRSVYLYHLLESGKLYKHEFIPIPLMPGSQLKSQCIC